MDENENKRESADKREGDDFWRDFLGDEVDLSVFRDGEVPGRDDDETNEPPARRDRYTYGVTRGGANPEPVPETDDEPDEDVKPYSPPRKAARNELPAETDAQGKGKSADGEDFKINFDFDKEYTDAPDHDSPLRRRRNKRTGCLGGVLYGVFIICVALLLGSLAMLAVTDVLGLGEQDSVVQITIPRDFTVDEVIDMLADTGLIKYKTLFSLYLDISKDSKKIVSGTYALNTNFDYRALVNGMGGTLRTRVQLDVTIPEGFTLAQIFKLFEEKRVCYADELWDAATNYDFDYAFLSDAPLGERHRLEGYLFPDTYTFYLGDSPTRAIGKMLSNFNTKFNEARQEKLKASGRSLRDIVIVASMIEREAGSDTDRPLIASVIYNRLANADFPRLEIDATIFYVIAETGESFTTSLDSPYNTYRVTGLPAGPISNPGTKSIDAALSPDTTEFYYYALGKEGSHRFFTTYAEQQEFVHSDEYGG
ncbi:MAG: endolytic transglycosylase MltG [Oscillospiraceae bacterium]|jgi:UPF0755 protein|nr:endolytic transglycosylase MltG [Oscillospiraceae bacterium]